MKTFHTVVAAAICAVMLVGAVPVAAAGSGRPVQLVLFLDCSPSVSPSQLKRWIEQGHGQIAQLMPGDAVQIYVLHDNTATASEAFDKTAPAGDTFSARRTLLSIRRDAAEALACPSGEGRGRDTDILAALDRIHRDTARDTVVLFFSDMLHSKGDPDIERRALPQSDRIPELARSVARRRGWVPDMLKGVVVRCVLNGMAQGAKAQSPNSRPSIEMFYRALFESVGARLDSFGTSVPVALGPSTPS